MTSHVRVTDICCRIDFATLQICQSTAFEAIRRDPMDVSEANSLCSRTRVKDFCFVSEHLLSMLNVVCVSSISKCFKLKCWASIGPCVLFRCSCHWVMTHAVCRVRLGLFGSDGLLFSIMLFVLLCCVLCTASGLSQSRVGVG